MKETLCSRACSTRATGLRVVVGLLFVGLSLADVRSADSWRAGAARTNITPRGELWMTGYGFRTGPTSAKLQDLWAKALALEDSAGRRSVLITADLCGITAAIASAVAANLERSAGLPRDRVLFNVSHPHCGPYVEGYAPALAENPTRDWHPIVEYRQDLERRLFRVVSDALADLAPAHLGWGRGTADFAVNRRNNPEAEIAALRTAGTLVGPVDHDVPVLSVRDSRNNLKAVVFGYACHNTVLREYAWVGDYAGFAQAALEQRHPAAVALFMSGCGADINPLPRKQLALAKRYGSQLADAVDHVLQGETRALRPAFAAGYKVIQLPYGHIPTQAELTREFYDPKNKAANRLRARLLLAKLATDEEIPKAHDYPVQVWRLGGELTLIALGGETVVDYALRLKRELGETTWVSGYSNDVMAYIPSERVLREGGYEGATSITAYALPSPWAPGLEDRIIATVKSLITGL